MIASNCRLPYRIWIVSLALLLGLSACRGSATNQAAEDALATTPAEVIGAGPGDSPSSAEQAASADQDGAEPRLEPVQPCFVEIPEEIDSAVKVDCGYVVVPEFHDGPSSRELKLGYVRFNASGANEGPPLFKLAGGPGQTNLGGNTLPMMAPHQLGSALAERDVVFLEQRGTEHTETFLDCPEYHRLRWIEYEEGLDRQQAVDRAGDVLRGCVEGFRAQGINLDAYNSVENAADVDAARHVLGYDTIIYYGASYGAQLGQHLMRDYPESLAGVILDGANALERKSWIEDRSLDAQFGIDHLDELCQADEKCAAAYDVPALVDAALGLFDAGPLRFAYPDPMDPSVTIEGDVTKADMVSFIFEKQGSHLTAMALPTTLSLLTQPENAEMAAQALGEWKATHLLASRDAAKGDLATVMHYAMVCSDDTVKSADELVVEGLGEYATLFGRMAADEYVRACEILGVKELPDETDVNVGTDVPTLLLAGHLDVSTPEYRTKTVADNLPRATMVSFADGTHVQVSGANPCALELLMEFAHDPNAPLDLTCAEERPLLGFVLPDGTMSNVEP